MGIFLAVIIVLVLMNGFFFYILKGIAARLGKFSQNNVLRQASIYDELIQNKEELLSDILGQLERENEQRPASTEAVRARASGVGDTPDYLAIRQGDYQDPRFAEDYRRIRNHFQFNKEQCIRKVLGTVPPEDSAAPACRILARFSLDECYQMSTLAAEDQIAVLEQLFDPHEQNMLHRYQDEFDSFSCHKFLDWLRELDFRYSSRIIVRSGQKDDNFDGVDSRIRTQYDSSVCEGIYVVAGGMLHDFSIRNREIGG